MSRGKRRAARKETSSRLPTAAGSNAGRGFRYQDAAAAWLAIRCWTGDLDYGGVIPEGQDDVELVGSRGRAYVQMKSRRQQLGPYKRGNVAAYLRELWERAEISPVAPGHLLLILERDVEGIGFDPEVATPLDGANALGALIGKHRLARRWMACTRLMVVSSPAESAVDLVVEKLACMPLLAAVYFAVVADRIGQLADGNGERSPADFLSLSASDVDREISALAGALSADDLDAALMRGLCEPVDFLTPLHDPNFYIGTDIQPGHLAAGLYSERPDARERVLHTLERRRAVLIAGPSGSGKSGLMWEAARESRHTVRWFRVRSAAEGDAPDLLRLADTFRATAHMPIGFVLDDVGRNRSQLWDTLAAEAAARPNVLLLGSLREEDLFLVVRRSLATEIREQADTGLAERIWLELRDRNQTTWPGWREPWKSCDGLLLEYAHLLTQGKHLRDVLRDQVDRRAREKRYVELSVLRITSVAGQTGATVDLSRLQHVLAVSDGDLSNALRRLIDEHLVRRLKTGERLGSLHQIRAAALAELTHAIPPPLKTETAKSATICIADADLEGFVARTLANEPELAEAIVDGAVERMRANTDLAVLAAIVRGLDAGSINDTIRRWLPQLDSLGLRRTHATMAAMLSVANTAPFLEERLQAHFEAARLLRETVHYEYRRTLIDRLEPELSASLSHDPDWREVTALLAALLGTALPTALETRLAESTPDLLSIPLNEVVDLLETAGTVAPALPKVWIDRIGQDALLQRLTRETAWISSAEFREEPEGMSVCADVYHVSDRLQPNLHADVVKLCRQLLALAPTADLVVSSAVAPDGAPAGLAGSPIATKRIRRSNLPANALPVRNRRWIAAVAQCVAPAGISQYLAEAKRLLDALVPLLEKLFDGAVRGKAHTKYLDELGAIHEAAKDLTRPPEAEVIAGEASGIGVSDLQNVLHHCSADLLRSLIDLPHRAAASYMRATDLLAQIDRAIADEPWTVIGEGPPSSMSRLREIVERLRLIIGEAGFRDVKAHQLAPRLTQSARPHNALRVLSVSITGQVDQRLKALNHALETAAEERGYRVRAYSRPVGEIHGPWPYVEVLAIVVLDLMENWPTALVDLAESLRQACGEGRRLIIVPALAGLSAPDLAISGVETLFPRPFNDAMWLGLCGFPPVDLPLARIFDSLAAALLEVSAIQAFRCAQEERARDEASAMSTALSEIERAQAELERELPAADRSDVIAHLNELRAQGPHLAKAFWQYMHGAPACHSVLVLTVIKLMVIDAEVSSHRAEPGPGPDL